MVEYLASKGASLDIKDENLKQTPLHFACANNKPKLVELIAKISPRSIDLTDGDERTALHLAVENDNPSIGKLLLIAGATVDVQDKKQETALHIASSKGLLEFVKLLISFKANPNIKQKDGSQPLHLAVYHGFEEIVSYLITTCKVDVNCKNFSGNTPLHIAIMQKQWKIGIFLCENGANLTVVNSDSNNPLFYAPSKMQSQLQEAANRFQRV